MLCFNIIKISVFFEFTYNFSVIQNKVLISFFKGWDKVILYSEECKSMNKYGSLEKKFSLEKKRKKADFHY